MFVEIRGTWDGTWEVGFPFFKLPRLGQKVFGRNFEKFKKGFLASWMVLSGSLCFPKIRGQQSGQHQLLRSSFTGIALISLQLDHFISLPRALQIHFTSRSSDNPSTPFLNTDRSSLRCTRRSFKRSHGQYIVFLCCLPLSAFLFQYQAFYT